MLDDKSPKEEGYFVEASGASQFCFEWVELIAQSLIFVVFISAFVFRIFTVSGNSMRNTLYNHDHVIVWEYGYKPKDGDIVVIRKNGSLDETIIKRVIATEGESIHLDYATGSVYVNGRLLSEPYIKEKMLGLSPDVIPTVIPPVIPKDCSFVMGDNRNNSTDSRDSVVGIIKNENIIGTAKVIYWPPYRIRKLESIRAYG